MAMPLLMIFVPMEYPSASTNGRLKAGATVAAGVAVGAPAALVGVFTGAAVPLVLAAVAGVEAGAVTAGLGVSAAFDPPHAARRAAATLAAIPLRNVRRASRLSMVSAP